VNLFRLAPINASRLVRLLGDWLGSGDTLYGQLAERVRQLARTGTIPAGTRLPSERSLGTALGISRNTVARAFDELRAEGVLASRTGDGTYVVAGSRHPVRDDDRFGSFASTVVEGDSRPRIDLRSAALPGLQMTADEINSLDGVRVRDLVASHGYLPAGLPELRAAIASYYDALGLPTEPDQVLVTSGAQQALRLVASLHVEPGSVVAIEEPSFRGAIQSLKALGARLVGVPTGPRGIDVDVLAATLSKVRPVLLVLQSTVHNPTGSVMDSLHRSRVAGLATQFGVPVVDDSTLADTIIDGDRLPLPLAAGNDMVITIGSMSKLFWGGLRVGWARAHTDLVERLTALKGGEDLGTSVLAQVLAGRLLSRVEQARDERHAVLAEARRCVLDAVDGLLPDWKPHVPAGGASLWVRLPAARATAFAQRADRDGVRVLPGPTFSASDSLDDHLRIAFTGPNDVTIRGIELLARTWEVFVGR
jgi:DNA-binding transcriptional MocR family regulator